MDALQAALSASTELSDFLHANLGAHAVFDSQKQVFVTALLSISLDHREATLLLVKAGAFPSAYALARSALEAYVTAEWLDLKADEATALAFISGKRDAPTFERMAQALRKVHPLGQLFEVLRGHYGTLSDYAHGRARQLSRWVTPDSIGPRHTSQEMEEVLCFVDLLGALAGSRREGVAGRSIDVFTPVIDGVLARVRELRARQKASGNKQGNVGGPPGAE